MSTCDGSSLYPSEQDDDHWRFCNCGLCDDCVERSIEYAKEMEQQDILARIAAAQSSVDALVAEIRRDYVSVFGFSQITEDLNLEIIQRLLDKKLIVRKDGGK